MSALTPGRLRLLGAAVHLGCLWPAAWLLFAALSDQLGPNPAEALIRGTGEWALRLLCLTLAVTPVRHWTGWHWMGRWRRRLGLYTFAYACLHLLAYAWLDMGAYLDDIARDIAKRPFILVGFLAWLMLLPLALTSFNRAVRWMGSRRWIWLHRGVYLIAGLAILHFLWMRSGKNDYGEVWLYGGILAILLGWRIAKAVRDQRRQAHQPMAGRAPLGSAGAGRPSEPPRAARSSRS